MHPYVVRMKKVECRLMQSESKTNATSCSPQHFLECTLIQSISILRVHGALCTLMQSRPIYGMHPYIVPNKFWSAISCGPDHDQECSLIQSPPRYHMVHIIILWSISFGQYYMHFITLYYSYDTNNIINTQCNFEVMPFSIEITSIWIILARLLSYSINQS